MYGDACIIIADQEELPGGLRTDRATFLTRCHEWSGGIMLQGLRSVLDEYVAAAFRIVDSRQRARIGNASQTEWGGTLGYITPTELYDYSQDNCTSDACAGTLAPFLGNVASEIPDKPLDPTMQPDVINYRGVRVSKRGVMWRASFSSLLARMRHCHAFRLHPSIAGL